MTELRKRTPPDPTKMGEVLVFKTSPDQRPKQTITKRDLARAILALDAVWPPSRIASDEMGEFRANIWWEALKDLSPQELKLAAQKCIKSKREFPPTPGIVRNLVMS